MFKIEYKISSIDYTDFIGDKGYYKMHCNENTYGDIFSNDLESIMGTNYLYDWVEDITKVTLKLQEVNYVALSDIESYNLWIEFYKDDEDLYISLVNADKPDGTESIAYELFNKSYSEDLWTEEKIKFVEFKKEIVRVVGKYVEDVKVCNADKIVEKSNLLQDLLCDLQ